MGARDGKGFATGPEADPIADKPTGDPLDFSQTRLGKKILNGLPAVDGPTDLVEKGWKVPLDIPIEGNQRAVEVVDDFDFAIRVSK